MKLWQLMVFPLCVLQHGENYRLIKWIRHTAATITLIVMSRALSQCLLSSSLKQNLYFLSLFKSTKHLTEVKLGSLDVSAGFKHLPNVHWKCYSSLRLILLQWPDENDWVLKKKSFFQLFNFI